MTGLFWPLQTYLQSWTILTLTQPQIFLLEGNKKRIRWQLPWKAFPKCFCPLLSEQLNNSYLKSQANVGKINAGFARKDPYRYLNSCTKTNASVTGREHITNTRAPPLSTCSRLLQLHPQPTQELRRYWLKLLVPNSSLAHKVNGVKILGQKEDFCSLIYTHLKLLAVPCNSILTHGGHLTEKGGKKRETWQQWKAVTTGLDQQHSAWGKTLPPRFIPGIGALRTSQKSHPIPRNSPLYLRRSSVQVYS